jgi:hypothetical protein
MLPVAVSDCESCRSGWPASLPDWSAGGLVPGPGPALRSAGRGGPGRHGPAEPRRPRDPQRPEGDPRARCGARARSARTAVGEPAGPGSLRTTGSRPAPPPGAGGSCGRTRAVTRARCGREGSPACRGRGTRKFQCRGGSRARAPGCFGDRARDAAREQSSREAVAAATRQRGPERPGTDTWQLFMRPPAGMGPGGVITSANESGIVLASPSQLCSVLFSPAVHKRHREGGNRASACRFPGFC